MRANLPGRRWPSVAVCGLLAILPSAATAQTTGTAPLIRILEPAAGATVAEDVWVRGIVDNGGREVAVSLPLPSGLPIPSIPAATEAGTFAAYLPLVPPTNVITVVATDVSSGAMSSATVVVAAQRAPTDPRNAPHMHTLRASPEAGFPPHAVAFATSSTLPPGALLSLDADGDGTIEFTGTEIPVRSFTYPVPGIYLPSMRVVTPDQQTSVYRAIVEVYDRAALDARIQTVWTGFAGALRAGDRARALTFVHTYRREGWQDYFNQFTPDQLASAGAQTFTKVELVKIGPSGAEYEMIREEGGQAVSYPVVFLVDVDGRWRLWQF